jgi:hypothetical protein
MNELKSSVKKAGSNRLRVPMIFKEAAVGAKQF